MKTFKISAVIIIAVAALIVVLAIAVMALANAVPATIQPDFTIGNGTGAAITQIEIRPSRAQYPKDKNVFVISYLTLENGQYLPVSLPAQMKGIETFDVTLRYGTKVAKTRAKVTLLSKGKAPVFVATIKGKQSTIPLTAGAVSGAGTAATIGAIAAYNVAKFGAGGLTYLLAIPGSMVAGITMVAAIPLLIGTGVFAIIQSLSSDTLNLVRIN